MSGRDPGRWVADDAPTALDRILPGWIEPGTRRDLLAATGDGTGLVAVVGEAWRSGRLRNECGMWWMPPDDLPAADAGVMEDGVVVEGIGVAAHMRERCEAGRPEEALALGFRAATALAPGSEGDPAREAALGAIGIATIFALVDAGRVHAALPAAEALHRECVERRSPGAQAWCAAARGTALVVTGRILDAREAFIETLLLARAMGDAALLAEVRRGLGYTFTVVGESVPEWPTPVLDGAGMDPEAAAPAEAGPAASVPADREAETRATAWTDPSPAHLRALAAAAEDARRAGRYGVSATLASDLALLGDPATALELYRKMGTLDGDLLPTMRPMAEALLAGDPVGLADHADRLEAMGMLGLAAVFTLLAVARRLEAGEEGTAVRDLLATANRRAAQVQLGPAYLESFRRLLPLRDRELEIARLAAEGHTNKEIAARLVLSTRTVENHLYRVYDKLGVTGRDELRRFLAGG